MKHFFATFLLLICTSAFADSQYMATDSMYQGIQRELDHVHGRMLVKDEWLDDQSFLASGWLAGVYETLLLNQEICPAGKISGVASDSIFVAYVDAHPKSYEQPAVQVAIASAMQAFPCRKLK